MTGREVEARLLDGVSWAHAGGDGERVYYGNVFRAPETMSRVPIRAGDYLTLLCANYRGGQGRIRKLGLVPFAWQVPRRSFAALCAQAGGLEHLKDSWREPPATALARLRRYLRLGDRSGCSDDTSRLWRIRPPFSIEAETDQEAVLRLLDLEHDAV